MVVKSCLESLPKRDYPPTRHDRQKRSQPIDDWSAAGQTLHRTLHCKNLDARSRGKFWGKKNQKKKQKQTWSEPAHVTEPHYLTFKHPASSASVWVSYLEIRAHLCHRTQMEYAQYYFRIILYKTPFASSGPVQSRWPRDIIFVTNTMCLRFTMLHFRPHRLNISPFKLLEQMSSGKIKGQQMVDWKGATFGRTQFEHALNQWGWEWVCKKLWLLSYAS